MLLSGTASTSVLFVSLWSPLCGLFGSCLPSCELPTSVYPSLLFSTLHTYMFTCFFFFFAAFVLHLSLSLSPSILLSLSPSLTCIFSCLSRPLSVQSFHCSTRHTYLYSTCPHYTQSCTYKLHSPSLPRPHLRLPKNPPIRPGPLFLPHSLPSL